MADVFVSYTSSDRDWAFWIGHELESSVMCRISRVGFSGGGDIAGLDGGASRQGGAHPLCHRSKHIS